MERSPSTTDTSSLTFESAFSPASPTSTSCSVDPEKISEQDLDQHKPPATDVDIAEVLTTIHTPDGAYFSPDNEEDPMTIATETTAAVSNTAPDSVQTGADAVTGSSNSPTSKEPQVTESNSLPTLSSWDVASEHVAAVALQCLSKDQDMELSYVSILSAMTVLQSKQDQLSEYEDGLAHQHQHLQDFRTSVAETYSQILRAMCRPCIAEGLGKETLHQGVMSSEALYTQLYGSIQQAGYDLEDMAHLAMAQYWIEHKKIEEAQDCLGRMDPDQWSGPAYRAAITCLLFSKPRQQQDAESLLQKYIAVTAMKGPNRSNADSKIRTWFKLQVEVSKWEEVKTQYAVRRSRLVNGPGVTERASAVAETESRLTPQALQQHQLREQSISPHRQSNHTRSISITSSTTTSSHRRSPSGAHSSITSGHQRTPSVAPSWPSGADSNTATGHQRTPSVAPSWPSGASAALNSGIPAAAPTPTKGAFSFLSSLKFTKSEVESAPALSTALPSRLNVNRHLTVLDNGMLEECISYKQFEYGWKYIYEKMGPSLEDNDTARIAMRLCRRAFLGHGGLDPNQVGSSNITAKDVYFGSDDGLDNDASLAKETWSSSLPPSTRDSEIWEARAWAIYNKAMMNPHSFLSTSNGPNQATLGALSQSGSCGATPTSLFLHDILTISVHSPEISSRYLKAFKVYSALRGDQQNQHQLRDPFVMSCMIKAIYDAALAVVYKPDKRRSAYSESKAEVMKHQRRSSSLSLNQSQPMTIGPLMDLAFEIYADMRNVGPIRHLPSLLTLAPTSPVAKDKRLSSFTPSISEAENDEFAEVPGNTSSPSTTTPRSSLSTVTMSIFQELNPTLKPNPQARHLPTELYLALIHLCIQVPVYRISSQVVQTIVADMRSESGRPLQPLDRHFAAALQCYHDSWMCIHEATETGTDGSDTRIRHGKCDYFEWMYKSDEEIEEAITSSERLL
ncbi:hypothetical protein BGZ98_002305, partial [Dissophora globulifera]